MFAENKRLKAANRKLRAENEGLRKENWNNLFQGGNPGKKESPASASKVMTDVGMIEIIPEKQIPSEDDLPLLSAPERKNLATLRPEEDHPGDDGHSASVEDG